MNEIIIIQCIFLFIFGLIIGSFLNVCIYRIPGGKSVITPSSFCPECNASIKWYDNIPVFSYLLLKGRCRACGNRISVQYPLVELLTGGIFVLIYVFVQYRQESLCVLISYLVLCCALIISTFVDLKLHIIPNEVTFTGIPVAIVLSVICPGLHLSNHAMRGFSLIGVTWLDGFLASITGIFIGGGLILLSSILGKWIFKKEAMGFGDVKLMAMIGGIVGWKLAVAIFFVAPFFGLLMAIPVLFLKKSHLIPYGPFLSLATLGCIVFQDFLIEYIDMYIQMVDILFTGFDV